MLSGLRQKERSDHATDRYSEKLAPVLERQGGSLKIRRFCCGKSNPSLQSAIITFDRSRDYEPDAQLKSAPGQRRNSSVWQLHRLPCGSDPDCPLSARCSGGRLAMAKVFGAILMPA